MIIYISVRSSKQVIPTSESFDSASQQIFERIKFQMVGVAVYRDGVLDFWKHWFYEYRVWKSGEYGMNIVCQHAACLDLALGT